MSDEFRRQSDQQLGQLIQMIKDDREESREWRDKHDHESAAWRERIDKRLEPLEDFIKQVRLSWKIVIGIGASIGSIGIGLWRVWHFIKEVR